MNQRKASFKKGLAKIRHRRLTKTPGRICAIRPSLYNAAGMPDTNQIIQGDCIQILNDGPEQWIDLVFADPPFNIGYLYHGYNDEQKADDYLKFSHDWMKAVYRALKPNGTFYLAIGDEYAADLCVIARRQLGFHMRNWIVWHYTFGQQTKMMYAKSHTHILYFTKAPDPQSITFNADAVRVASARQTTYKDVRANPKGKLPDDVWYLRPQETPEPFFAADSDTWNISRVCGTFKEREGWHGCQMPIDVLTRIIKASSNPGDVVVDPFNGSGTTIVAAATLGRQYVGIDQSAEYVAHANKRLAHVLEQMGQHDNGTELFPLGSLIDPTRTSKVKTATDAFGRPRVLKRKYTRHAKTA
jgi:DNA modification methylase